MANFPPLKNHLLRCVDELIARHGATGPFLDAGCGGGDVALHLARKGWGGTAIDASADAVARARTLLADHSAVRVEHGSFFDRLVDQPVDPVDPSDLPDHADRADPFQTVLALDVVEHLEDDEAALRKLSALLPAGGHLIVSVPSNPREWRWDDDVFGHYRRYTGAELGGKLRAAGLTPLAIWDFTFPVFWLMRRAYTRLIPPPPSSDMKEGKEGMRERTEQSAGRNPWSIPLVSGLLSRDNFFWRAVSDWQFRRFRHRLARGHEFVALARKD